MLLQSRSGEIKTEQEWKDECSIFYFQLKADRDIPNQWERYQRVIGLQPVNNVRKWDGRKTYVLQNYF